MVMCARCHKRVAVVFMTKLVNGKRINEGVCMKCAQEMGLPLGNLLGDYMNKMGVSPEQLVEMEDGIADMLENGEADPEGGAPAIDFQKLFGGMPSSEEQTGETPDAEGKDSAADHSAKKDRKDKKDKKKKFLDTYCTNLTRRAADGELDTIVGR